MLNEGGNNSPYNTYSESFNIALKSRNDKI